MICCSWGRPAKLTTFSPFILCYSSHFLVRHPLNLSFITKTSKRIEVVLDLESKKYANHLFISNYCSRDCRVH